jgi:simple sugar transport system permease protein
MAALRKVLVRPELGAVTAAIGVFVFFSIIAGSRGFLTTQGTINYLEVGAEHGILAVSVALLMIAGEFDLSIGSMIGAAGMIIAIPVTKFGWPPWLAILAAFAFSLAVGFLNGWLVVKTRLPSFIITLASLYLLRGFTFGLTIALLNFTRASGMGAYLSGDPLVAIFSGAPLGLKISIWWWAALTLVLGWVLFRTPYGNWIFAAGGDALAARSLPPSSEETY